MGTRPTILVIDDEPKLHKILARLLRPELLIESAYSGLEGLKKVELISPDLIILDLRIPQMSGMSVLKKLKEKKKDIPVIILTSYGNVTSAVQAIKLGATDYIEKPFDNKKLKQMLIKLLEGRKKVQDLQEKLGIIGKSPPIKKVWQMVEKFGPTDLPVLLQGETGTGKELFSRAIHALSKRSSGPFVPVECSSLPESLIESEIFGYKKGAFTDAYKDKPGRLECANGGTLFLDEVSNLPLRDQAKFLRVLQERQYVPLGANKPEDVDIRLVSATNADLIGAIERGNFREDLYYRINGVVIELPPLRERKGDIELLAHHFVKKYGRKYNKQSLEISDEAIDLLSSYSWPGNVRELEYVIAQAVILADSVILPSHLHLHFHKYALVKSDNTKKGIELEIRFDPDKGPVDLKKIKKKVAEKIERLIINEVRKKTLLNQTELAKYLGIDPKTLRSKMKDNFDANQ